MEPKTAKLLQHFQSANGHAHIGDTFFKKVTVTESEKTALKSIMTEKYDTDTFCGFDIFTPSGEPLFKVNTIRRAQKYRADSSWIFTSRIPEFYPKQKFFSNCTDLLLRVINDSNPTLATHLLYFPVLLKFGGTFQNSVEFPEF